MTELTLTSSRLFSANKSVFPCTPEIAALPIEKGRPNDV